jgi:hypothetical protein
MHKLLNTGQVTDISLNNANTADSFNLMDYMVTVFVNCPVKRGSSSRVEKRKVEEGCKLCC